MINVSVYHELLYKAEQRILSMIDKLPTQNETTEILNLFKECGITITKSPFINNFYDRSNIDHPR